MDASIFEQIASSLTVKAICGPLGPDIPVDADEATLEQIYSDPDRLLDPVSNPCRVIASDGQTVGMVWYEDWDDDDLESRGIGPVREVMQPLEPHEFLTSATTILDAVEIFGAKGRER